MAEQDNDVVKFVKGKKTYFVAATILTCGILEHYGIHVPIYIWTSLAALGLGFLRAGVEKK